MGDNSNSGLTEVSDKSARFSHGKQRKTKEDEK